MTTSTYPTGQHNYWGIIKVAGGLLAIVLVAVFILNRGNIPTESPADTSKITIEALAYSGCIDIGASVQTYPGRSAMYADTHYVACDVSPALTFAVAEGDSGYILTDPDGDKFACAAIPANFADLQACGRVQTLRQQAIDAAQTFIGAVKG